MSLRQLHFLDSILGEPKTWEDLKKEKCTHVWRDAQVIDSENDRIENIRVCIKCDDELIF